ncbi:hypothetical protein LTR51_006399 [Lithohypha guttulata]|nr:hypothetical protein LTR51_006399 [Lithohypha guttulata]
MAKPLIRVIGSIHLDFVTTTPRCPSAGETLQATRFDINAGGKGANQAAACGRASFLSQNEQDIDVEMLGAVGKDDPYYASLLQPALHDSGVKTDLIAQIAGTTTGSATIIVDEGAGGENRILFVPGAGFKGMDNVKEILSRGMDQGRQPDVVVLQGEIPRDSVLALVEQYNASGGTEVVFNPAPVWPQGIPARTLKSLSALIVNENECSLLVKSMVAEGYQIHNVDKQEDLDEDTLRKVAHEFHTLLHVTTMIITLGSRGVFWSQSNGKSALVNATKVEKVVDTTAAGDTFVGYFTAELARSRARGVEFDVPTACGKAAIAAAKCVTRAGAMQSIPYGYE